MSAGNLTSLPFPALVAGSISDEITALRKETSDSRILLPESCKLNSRPRTSALLHPGREQMEVGSVTYALV
jgi:hypothetical protein